MRLDQLRYFCAIVDSDFNVSRAADLLHISQPAISKQVRLLEDELRVELLVRSGGRILRLTPAGHAVLPRAREVLNGISDIGRLGLDLAGEHSGTLIIATTHTHARYSLLRVIAEFIQKYPNVQLRLVQANPHQVLEYIRSGKAHLGLSSDEGHDEGDLLRIEGAPLGRCVMAPLGHPLHGGATLTLDRLRPHPLIILDQSFAGGRAVLEAFARAGMVPTIAMTATDSDVIKAYARLGIGVAVLPHVTFSADADAPLQAIPADHLFGAAPSAVLLRADAYVPGFMRDFIARVTQAKVRKGEVGR